MKSQGRTFQARVLGPLEVPKERFESGEYTLVAVPIDRDWKLPTKLEMVRDANNLLRMPIRSALLITLVTRLLSERLLRGKDSISTAWENSFCCTAGLSVRKGPEVEARMNDLLQGNEQGLKDYVQGGRSVFRFTVRNILAHVGRNPNQVTVEESQGRRGIAKVMGRRLTSRLALFKLYHSTGQTVPLLKLYQ